MEPNNGVPAQQPAAPVQQQQAPPSQPTTPQVQYQNINPNTGQPVTPPPQQQTQQPQISEEALATRLRSDLAQNFNISVDQLPSDYQGLLRINAGAYALMQRQQAEQNNRSLPNNQPPPPQQPQNQPPANPLAERPMAPGWQNHVQKDANGQWQPTHPHFNSIAQDANYNESIRHARSNAVTSGQLLPEHTQSIEQIVQQRMAAERESIRGEMFINQHAAELYQMNEDGTRRTQINPQTMQPEDMATPLGVEMRAAAAELRGSGATFNSPVDLATMAMKIAKERVKARQQMTPPAQVPPNPQHKDLQDLLNSHQRSGTTSTGTVNTAPQQFKDFRSELRSVLQNIPDGASGMELAKAIGFNF